MATPDATDAVIASPCGGGADQECASPTAPRTVVGFTPSRQASFERDNRGPTPAPAFSAHSLLTQELEVLVRQTGRRAFENEELGEGEEEDDDDDESDESDGDEMCCDWACAPPATATLSMSWSASSGAPSLAGAASDKSSSSSQPIAIPATT